MYHLFTSSTFSWSRAPTQLDACILRQHPIQHTWRVLYYTVWHAVSEVWELRRLTFNPPPPELDVVIACFSVSSCFLRFLSTASGFLTPLYVVWEKRGRTKQKAPSCKEFLINTFKHFVATIKLIQAAFKCASHPKNMFQLTFPWKTELAEELLIDE